MCLIGGVWYTSPLNFGKLYSGYKSQEEDCIMRSSRSFDLFISEFATLLVYTIVLIYVFQAK